MMVTKQDIQFVEHFWTSDINVYGLVKEYTPNLKRDFYIIYDLRTGFLVHMEKQSLYDYVVNEMLRKGVVIFNSKQELPNNLTIEEHQKYIEKLILSKKKSM